MNLLIVLLALAFLMLVAYRGYSVILFAPVAALGAVLLVDPSLVAPMFTSVFMKKMVGFLENYFPVFMLGAVFGKVIEISGFSKSISLVRKPGSGNVWWSSASTSRIGCDWCRSISRRVLRGVISSRTRVSRR